MPLKAVLTRVDKTLNRIIADGVIELSDNYASKGVTLDLSQLGVPASGAPIRVEAWSTVDQGAVPLQDFYTYVPGASAADGKLQIAVAGSEMAAAAFSATSPTSATGYVLHFRAEFEAFI